MAVAPELFHVDKLTCDIFSMLENKFLFGPASNTGRVRILSIDGGASSDGVFAAASLARLEGFLRAKSGCSDSTLADYFDVAAGSGSGGILAALMFVRGKDNRPMFSAHNALELMLRMKRSSSRGLLKRIVNPSQSRKKARVLDSIFGNLTLKDALKPLLIPCYDTSSRAPFLFSRADGLEIDGYDFRISDICAATSADSSPVESMSVDGKTRIAAAGGGSAMNNPTASAITHVLNNKMEFPLCKGMEDLLVVSIGYGSPTDGAADMVDQAVGMAFGSCRGNYVRIEASEIKEKTKKVDAYAAAEASLSQRNVESVLFQGKKLSSSTNLQKLEAFAGELVQEDERRKTCIVPFVVFKQNVAISPRSSSSTLSSSSC